nr:MAG TPA: hypothetical protein [Caudoviricetes sp.]
MIDLEVWSISYGHYVFDDLYLIIHDRRKRS